MLSSNKKTILLTGATGFLGSHILRRLINRNYQVILLKRSTSDSERINDLLPHAIVYNVDVISLKNIFEKHHIDIVIHTATCYGRSGESVSEIVKSNLLFPLELLELSISTGLTAFLNTDTFTNNKNSLPEGLEYYALTKSGFLDFARQLINNDQLKFVNMHLEHIYGQDDNSQKFIPFIINTFLDDKEKLELTLGEQKRDFVYVDDVVSAYETLIENISQVESKYSSYDVGYGESTTLKECVEMVRYLCGSKTDLVFGALDYRKNEVMNSKADIEKLKKLGWQPNTLLSEGLRNVINSVVNRHN